MQRFTVGLRVFPGHQSEDTAALSMKLPDSSGWLHKGLGGAGGVIRVQSNGSSEQSPAVLSHRYDSIPSANGMISAGMIQQTRMLMLV